MSLRLLRVYCLVQFGAIEGDGGPSPHFGCQAEPRVCKADPRVDSPQGSGEEGDSLPRKRAAQVPLPSSGESRLLPIVFLLLLFVCF